MAAAAAQPEDSLASKPPELLNLIAEEISGDVLYPQHLGQALKHVQRAMKLAVKDALKKLRPLHAAARKLVAKGLYLHDDTVECPRVLNLTRKLHRVEIRTLVSVLKVRGGGAALGALAGEQLLSRVPH